MGTFTQAIDSFNDLVGGKVTRRRTLGKYLDGEPGADTTQEFPIDIYYIERKVTENALSITWQLVSIIDLEGLQLPRRVVTQNYCQWKYRSSECGYTGAPTIGANDTTISSVGQSASAIAVLNAAALEKQRTVVLQNAINARNIVAAKKEADCADDALLESRFNSPEMAGVDYYVTANRTGVYAFGATNGSAAVWNGNPVLLGRTYRQGENEGSNYYSIELRGFNPVACAAATAALVTAEAAVTAAGNSLLSAQAALNAAVAALPANDLLRQQDICGKRVSSCQLRFQPVWNNASRVFQDRGLPFGGFPGAIQGRQ
jgi:phage-related protein